MCAAILAATVGAFIHFGAVCTSYCWINAGTHKRSRANPDGDTRYPYVRDGTQLASLTAAMCILCWARGLVFSIENPVNSMLLFSRKMQGLLRYLQERSEEQYQDISLLRHHVPLGSFGAATAKPVWFFMTQDPCETSGIVFSGRVVSRHPLGRIYLIIFTPGHRPPRRWVRRWKNIYPWQFSDLAAWVQFPGCGRASVYMHTVRYVDWDGRTRTAGGPGLKETQTYPDRPDNP